MNYQQYMEIPTEDIIMAQEASRTPSSIHETVYENDGDPITLLTKLMMGMKENGLTKLL